jgi:hypothetical protein
MTLRHFWRSILMSRSSRALTSSRAPSRARSCRPFPVEHRAQREKSWRHFEDRQRCPVVLTGCAGAEAIQERSDLLWQIAIGIA